MAKAILRRSATDYYEIAEKIPITCDIFKGNCGFPALKASDFEQVLSFV